ncbi:MAG: hypothetical protein EXR59_02275 [Dehalococcoidia bacterium]|nr:hypothetical protein [Dehalococcoidia bacterium]
MDRKILVILCVSGALSLTLALSTMSVALARTGRSNQQQFGQTSVTASQEGQQKPGDHKGFLVSGTVKSVSPTSIVVNDSTGKDVTVTVNGDTGFTVKGAVDKTISQILVGQKATIFQDADGVAKMIVSSVMPKRPELPGMGRMGPRRGPEGLGGGPGRPRMGLSGPGIGMSAYAGLGTVAQISDTSITITLAHPASGGAATETYFINGDTKIMPVAGQTKIAVGDNVLVVPDEGKVAKSIMRSPAMHKPAKTPAST